MRRLLLTPGPLTTSEATRRALTRDWGSREKAFVDLTARVRSRLLALVNGERTHVVVPIQGSGTFAVEAALQTLLAPDGKLLVLVNGAYGHRIADIARRLGRQVSVLEGPEDQAVDCSLLEKELAIDPAITDVAIVHCETTTGLVNPLDAIAAITQRGKRGLFVDAMSSFGVFGIDIERLRVKALIGCPNKCLEGVPGVGFVIADKSAMAGSRLNAASTSLDLYEQWRHFEEHGQWRFTPPTHVIAALDAALDQLTAEGGSLARRGRYRKNCDILITGMRAMGFETVLADDLQSPVIVTFKQPQRSSFSFDRFYDFLSARDIIIYPGKLTKQPTFRIGCIGAIAEPDIVRVLDAVGAFIQFERPTAEPQHA